jgi:hypothetical protein
MRDGVRVVRRRRVVFVDLDSTLASTWHRRHLINWDDIETTDWEAYALACEDDPIFEGVRKLVYDLSCLYWMIAVTGRYESAREPTKRWIRKHQVHFDELLMRPMGNRRENEEFKIDAIEAWLAEHPDDELYLLVDDWPAVVEPAKERGWDVLLVNPNYPLEESKSNRKALTGLPV